ncbi:MAG: hypothetical protein M1835_007689 [Candelina submexicana]|nr:MAG: hypothetical protein M1835_007689 [Candelina submexicana]
MPAQGVAEHVNRDVSQFAHKADSSILLSEGSTEDRVSGTEGKIEGSAADQRGLDGRVCLVALAIELALGGYGDSCSGLDLDFFPNGADGALPSGLICSALT